MAVAAVVREWHSDEGWGVIDAPETPGGCWAHFSHVAIGGYRELTSGDAVELEWELAGQNGYSYRAVRVWPADVEPAGQGVDSAGAAYNSTLVIVFDDDRET